MVWPATVHGQAREERRHARHVAVLLAGTVGVAEHDVVDEGRVDAAARDRLADDEGGQVVGPDGAERAAVPADGRAHGADDPGLAERPMQVAGHSRMLARAGQPAWPPAARSATAPPEDAGTEQHAGLKIDGRSAGTTWPPGTTRS